MWNGAAWQNWQKTVRLFQAVLKPRPIITPATYFESTLVEVLIPNNLNFFKINTFEKQGEGGWLLLTKRTPKPACPACSETCKAATLGRHATFLAGKVSAALVSARRFPYPIKVVTAATVALWCNG